MTGRDLYLPRDLLIILICFLILGLAYDLASPVLEKPDELAHYAYVRWLADGHGLPVQPPPEGARWQQEGSQPPLYYAVMALVTRRIDTDNLGRLGRLNPGIGQYIHGHEEDFPWKGDVLAIRIIRVISLLIGSITLGATYHTALLLFPGDRRLALGAAALNGFLPQFSFVSGAVSNDGMVIALLSLAMWILLRMWRNGFSISQTMLLGVLTGLAVLTKLNALLFVPVALLYMSAMAIRWRSFNSLLQGLIAYLLPIIALSGWWFARNWTIYQDPSGIVMMLDVIGQRDSRTLGQLLSPELTANVIESFWGAFSHGWLRLHPAIYGVLNIAALSALLSLIRTPPYAREWRWLGLWILANVLGLVYWLQIQVTSFVGRLTFPAISAFSILIAYGLRHIFTSRRGLEISWAGLGILSLTIPFVVIGPVFQRPVASPGEIPYTTRIDFEDSLSVVGLDFSHEPVDAGEPLAIALYWQARGPVTEDHTASVKVFQGEWGLLGQADMYLGTWYYPTNAWRPGSVIRESFDIQLDPSLIKSETDGLIEIVVYHRTAENTLRLEDRSQIRAIVAHIRIHPANGLVRIEGPL